MRKSLNSIGVGILFGLGCLIWLITNHMGLNHVIGYLSNRFIHRTFLSHDASIWLTWCYKMWMWYVIGFGSWLVVLFISCAVLFRNKFNVHSPSERTLLFFVMSLTLASLCYKLVFMQFSVEHDYVALIDSIAIALIVSIHGVQKGKKSLYVACIVFSIVQYYLINRPGTTSQRGDRYDQFLKAGKIIRSTSKPDAVVFTTGNSYNFPANNPQLMYYSKSNICPIRNIKEAKLKLTELGISEGNIYDLARNKIIKQTKVYRK